jgi:drug/metabolite transporter (DMT)-like permease
MLFNLLLPALLVAALWGYIPIIEKKLLEHISIKTLMVLFGLLYGLISLVLGIIYYKDISKDLQNKEILEKLSFKLLLFMVIIYVIGSLIYYILLKDNQSHVVVALTYTTPIFVALFSYLLS